MEVLNINIGLLGHVDSGKTSLAKKLSEVSSTAAFDKSKQSKERGITLDLGFSALIAAMPEHLKPHTTSEELQLTFVDCPGHASLLKTIIGGAQIIDFIILVIDVTKGIQTQTAECLVIGEITCPKRLIVALNKIDLLEVSKRESLIEKMTKKLNLVLATTVFKDCPIVPISTVTSDGLDNFREKLKQSLYVPKRSASDPFLFAVDHCFQITGQGTICTGTVLQGQVTVNEEIEVPRLKVCRKVKTIQMFRKPIRTAKQGDRVGICLTQFSESQMERGILASVGYLKYVYMCILKVNRIKYFRQVLKTKSKLHFSIGHETVMGKVLFFESTQSEAFTVDDEFRFVEEIESLSQDEETKQNLFVLVEFDRPVLVTTDMLLIASHMHLGDPHKNLCRLAFYGYVSHFSEDKEYQANFLPKIKIYKEKSKTGAVQRVVSNQEIIAVNLFKKESDRSVFVGLNVVLSTGEKGLIESTFGKTNKIKIQFRDALSEETMKKLEKQEVKVILNFKKYIFDKTNKIRQ